MTYWKASHSEQLLNWGQPLLLVSALVLAWHFLVSWQVWDPTIVPSPLRTIQAAWEFRSTLSQDMLVTLGEVVLGFVITTAATIVVSVGLHTLPRLSRGVYGLLVVLQSVPLWGIAPVLFYWFGPGWVTRLVVIVLVAFFPVLVNTVEGLRHIDRELLDLFDSMNASRWQKLTILEIPSAVYMVITGSKITLTMCVIGAVLAEMLIGDMIGLGYRLKEAGAHFRIDLVFASVALLSLVVIVLYGLLTLAARRLQPWEQSKEN